MSIPTALSDQAGRASSTPPHPDAGATRIGPLSLLVLALWCGLLSGVLEVGITVLRKELLDANHFYWMSRHFVWLIPLTNLVVFLVLAIILSPLLVWGGVRGRWLVPRLLATLTLTALIWAASPRIYGPAGFVLATGVGVQLTASLERRRDGFRRLVRLSFPIIASVALILAGSLWGIDRLRHGREEARPLPAAVSPNVLLIVLDTVAAEHLKLHGYDRATSTTLEGLARRGIRFDRAIAPSSWTLPSHASMFTGRWPHELSVGRLTPLDATAPTLAGFLASRGYATAGFIANRWYCASDSGLGRGFTVYCDAIYPGLSAFKSAALIDRPLDGLLAVERVLEEQLDITFLKAPIQHLWDLFKADRKPALVVNREFFDWLDHRNQPQRPYFAFLNYYDAHHPYQLPETAIHRFGNALEGERDRDLLEHGAPPNQTLTESQIAPLRDAYDDCVADLDERLGLLVDELDRRGELERTWLIVTSDHGESFGEHPGIFLHGTSLYQTEIHVPLVIVPPSKSPRPTIRVVPDAVSLRNLAATVVDLLGLRAGSPFPGVSLARHWDGSSPPSLPLLAEVVPMNGLDPDPAQLLVPRWPWAALIEGEWTYIRHEGDAREELYHWPDDPRELQNRAADPALQATLERMRQSLHRLTRGPLTPQRFPR